jgi:hypothetical protein
MPKLITKQVSVFPTNISFNYWASQLIVDFPESYLPVPPEKEEKWANWAEIVSTKSPFREKSIPSPFAGKKIKYKSWEEWANILYYLQNYS